MFPLQHFSLHFLLFQVLRDLTSLSGTLQDDSWFQKWSFLSKKLSNSLRNYLRSWVFWFRRSRNTYVLFRRTRISHYYWWNKSFNFTFKNLLLVVPSLLAPCGRQFGEERFGSDEFNLSSESFSTKLNEVNWNKQVIEELVFAIRKDWVP